MVSLKNFACLLWFNNVQKGNVGGMQQKLVKLKAKPSVLPAFWCKGLLDETYVIVVLFFLEIWIL